MFVGERRAIGRSRSLAAEERLPVVIEIRKRRCYVNGLHLDSFQSGAGEELLEWVAPSGGVVCFPRMRNQPFGGTAAFYERLLGRYGTYVGPGHWFEMPDTHFRLGYGWSTGDELEAGLEAISGALRG